MVDDQLNIWIQRRFGLSTVANSPTYIMAFWKFMVSIYSTAWSRQVDHGVCFVTVNHRLVCKSIVCVSPPPDSTSLPSTRDLTIFGLAIVGKSGCGYEMWQNANCTCWPKQIFFKFQFLRRLVISSRSHGPKLQKFTRYSVKHFTNKVESSDAAHFHANARLSCRHQLVLYNAIECNILSSDSIYLFYDTWQRYTIRGWLPRLFTCKPEFIAKRANTHPRLYSR